MRKRDEALSKGITPNDTVSSMQRRSSWHDYSAVGTYMLTLTVAGRRPLLGTLTSSDSPDADSARIALSALGRQILTEEIAKIHHFYPMVEVWKTCIMPDHIHMIVRVSAPMGKGKHLGQFISGFKAGCSRAWWALSPDLPCGEPQGTVAKTPTAGAAKEATAGPARETIAEASRGVTVPCGSPQGNESATAMPSHPLRPLLFERGYNDKILLRPDQLENWKHYLDDNPRRLLLKRRHPDLFLTIRDINIAERNCQMIGNRFLLNIPDKHPVIVHRAYSDFEYEALKAQWLAAGEAGAVLVSAAIAQKEKEVMRTAMDRGYSIILLRENGFPDLYKPSGEAFDACADGRLLLICPWRYHSQQTVISRSQCLQLNHLAEDIAKM